MTHHPIRTEPDGTRVYSRGQRYRPKPVSERKYAVRKPEDPRAVRWRGEWLLPLKLVAEAQRVLPATRSDEEAYDHMPRPCTCDVCRRGPDIVGRWQRKWQRDQGLRPRAVSPA